MKLRFNERELIDFANRYEYQSDEILSEISKSAKINKYLTQDEFIKICEWKTPRSKPKVASNQEEYIKEITNISLTPIWKPHH